MTGYGEEDFIRDLQRERRLKDAVEAWNRKHGKGA